MNEIAYVSTKWALSIQQREAGPRHPLQCTQMSCSMHWHWWCCYVQGHIWHCSRLMNGSPLSCCCLFCFPIPFSQVAPPSSKSSFQVIGIMTAWWDGVEEGGKRRWEKDKWELRWVVLDSFLLPPDLPETFCWAHWKACWPDVLCENN